MAGRNIDAQLAYDFRQKVLPYYDQEIARREVEAAHGHEVRELDSPLLVEPKKFDESLLDVPMDESDEFYQGLKVKIDAELKEYLNAIQPLDERKEITRRASLAQQRADLYLEINKARAGVPFKPNVLANSFFSDEEISNVLGGKEEIAFIQNSAQGFPCAINCETAEGDEVVLARKGIVKYRLNIKGVGGHSGKKYFEAKNAILEASHKIIALHSESRPGGTTYSCNVISAGIAPNSIPDSCTVTVDIRALTPDAIQVVLDTVERIANTSYIGGTTCQAELLSIRPPMVRTPETQALYDNILAACHKYGLGTLTPMETGGGSDSCYTQAAGVPSICGMGASGGLQHTPKEFLYPASIPLRAKILAGFLQE